MLGIKFNNKSNHAAALEQLNILQKVSILKDIKNKFTGLFSDSSGNHSFTHKEMACPQHSLNQYLNHKQDPQDIQTKSEFTFEDLHSGISLEEAISLRPNKTVFIDNNGILEEYIFVHFINKDYAFVKSCTTGCISRKQISMLKSAEEFGKIDASSLDVPNPSYDSNITKDLFEKGNIVEIDFLGQIRQFIINEKFPDGKLKLSDTTLNYFIVVHQSKVLNPRPPVEPILKKGDLVSITKNNTQTIYEFDKFQKDNKVFVKDLVNESLHVFDCSEISKYNK